MNITETMTKEHQDIIYIKYPALIESSNKISDRLIEAAGMLQMCGHGDLGLSYIKLVDELTGTSYAAHPIWRAVEQMQEIKKGETTTKSDV